nr:MAG TPA: hypothetical protein [Caudoviricetes sp.]
MVEIKMAHFKFRLQRIFGWCSNFMTPLQYSYNTSNFITILQRNLCISYPRMQFL